MLTFQKYYSLNENRFRQRKNQTHIIDLPMFSVFVGENAMESYTQNENEYKENLKKACAEARNKIHKLGFPSMHANILIKDLSDRVNQNTGRGVPGLARRKGKYMEVDKKYVEVSSDYLVTIIVHEWAHLWMFNNSKQFKRAVKQYYNLIRDYSIESYTSQSNAYDYLDADYPNIIGYGNQAEDDAFTLIVNKIWHYISTVYHSLYTISYPDPDDISLGYWAESSKEYYNKRESYLVKALEDIIIEGCVVIDPSVKNEMRKYEKLINKMATHYAPILLPHIDKKTIYDNSNIKWDMKNHPEMSLYDVAYLGDRNKYQASGKGLDKYQERYYLVYEIFSSPDIVALLLNLIYHVLQMTKKEKVSEYQNFSGKEKNDIREKAKDLVKWTDSYGMSNDDELWATGIEQFLDLPYQHRRKIVELMGTR
jgi:hypothetical protein